MAQFIPNFTEAQQRMDTAGERRVAKFLQRHLPDDCTVWCNIPIGPERLQADFLILMPQVGLLCLEVKDWKIETLDYCNPQKIGLKIKGETVSTDHPLSQARRYAQYAAALLGQDRRLLQTEGAYSGRLAVPFACGVVFSNVFHRNIRNIREQMGGSSGDFDNIFPIRQILYQEDLGEEASNRVYSRLAKMFINGFRCSLDAAQIDRIRYCLFPEIRIRSLQQQDLFGAAEPPPEQPENGNNAAMPDAVKPMAVVPDIIRVMDFAQETLARSMGGGHRVIHGVAGSGKTLILGLRCQYLVEQVEKPVLVLCFNKLLAAHLNNIIDDRVRQPQLREKIHIHHFHGWCAQLVKQHNIAFTDSEKKQPYHEAAVSAAVRAAQNGEIPTACYGAVLIDEGHDFVEPDWLRLIVGMLDGRENHLLLLYDDAQSIYHSKNKGLKFTMSSVGIKAVGRTTILKHNYRNTRQIIGFAHIVAQNSLIPHEGDDDTAPLVEPCASGADGAQPVVRGFKSWQDELDFLDRCLDKWTKTTLLRDIAVICNLTKQCEDVCKLLKQKKLPYHPWHKADKRGRFDPKADKIAVVTIKSSKGMEFPRVLLMGADQAAAIDEDDPVRLLYVGMTRAQNELLVSYSGSNPIARLLQRSQEQWNGLQKQK